MKFPCGRATASILSLALAACATHAVDPGISAPAKAGKGYEVSVARTSNGVPHVTAKDWGSLGYGFGYTIAQDNLCTMAAAFVTLRAERSRYFGAGGKAPHLGALEAASNLDSDFLFRLVVDADELADFRDRQDPKFTHLVAGYAEGYSRYVAEIKAGEHSSRHADCRAAEWLGAINSDDVFRRFYTANLALSETQMISAVANEAMPMAESGGYAPAAQAAASDPTRPGGNADASGIDASASKHGLLFGNPHWLWAGMDRFYQVHLRIPGERDVQGASIMGIPLVLIGFNREIGWNHAVSTAKRFTFQGLDLGRNDPRAYIYDGRGWGRDRKRQTTRIEAPVSRADRSQAPFAGTRHGSHSGPMIGKAGGGDYATPLRSLNADNLRLLRNGMRWEQARSMGQLQKREAAISWVNGLAAAGDDPRRCQENIGSLRRVHDGEHRACGAAGMALHGSRADVAAPDLVASIDSGSRRANAPAPPTGFSRIDKQARVPRHGNSYMQMVKFDEEGPRAWTRILPAQSTDPASPYSRDGIRRHGEEEWYRAAYTQAEIDADTVESVQLSGAVR